MLPILPDGEGRVTEGPGFNVFTVANGRVSTPASGVLEGITRRTAVEIAEELGHEVLIGDMPVSALYEADEIFLTSTAGGVMAVTTLDGRAVSGGSMGPVTRAIRDRYWELHADPRYSEEVPYHDQRPRPDVGSCSAWSPPPVGDPIALPPTQPGLSRGHQKVREDKQYGRLRGR